jgi:hypothetical protein
MSTNLLTPDIPRLHSIAATLEQKQLTYLRGKVLTVSPDSFQLIIRLWLRKRHGRGAGEHGAAITFSATTRLRRFLSYRS